MKKILFIFMLSFISGCGYQSVNNELTGQVKKVVRETPLICPNFYAADISLGVMRNGVGSMSSEDVWVYVADVTEYRKLKEAASSGSLVKVTYDVKRFTFCTPGHWLSTVEIIK